MKIRLIIVLSLVAALQGMAQTASTYISQGTNYFSNHDILNANAQFALAVQASPTNETANALLAITRILSIPLTQPGSNFLNRLGVSATNRNLYAWTATFPTTTNGGLVLPTNFNTSEAISFYTTNIMVALAASATNLANVKSTSFTLELTPAETGSQDTYLDYGDIQLLRSGIAAAQFAGNTLNAYNLNILINHIKDLSSSNSLSAQQILTDYPSLATFASTAQLTASKSAFTNFISLYVTASQYILKRSPGALGLFTIPDTEIAMEAEFRTDLTNALASLSGPVHLDTNSAFLSSRFINLSNYFSGTTAPRTLFPQVSGNQYVNNTLPDYTFGGVLLNEPAYLIEAALRKAVVTPSGFFTSWDGNDVLFVDAGHTATFIYPQNTFQFQMTDFGYWNETNASGTASISFESGGWVYGNLNAPRSGYSWFYANQQSNLGPYQGTAGLYSGTWSQKSGYINITGKMWALLTPQGNIYVSKFNNNSTLDFCGPASWGYMSPSGWLSNTLTYTSSDQRTVLASFTGTSFTGYVTNFYNSGVSPAYFTLNLASQAPYDMPPTVTAQPTNAITGVSSNGTFIVAATGNAPLCYQWYCNGQPILWATSPTLTLSNASLSLNGNYYSVSVRNVAGGTNIGAYFQVVDTVAPSIAISNLISGQQISNSTFVVNGSAVDNSGVSAVWVQVGTNGVWTQASTINGWTNWFANLNLNPGTNLLRVYSVDNASSGNLYVADCWNSVIRKVTPTGVVTTLAGDVYDLTNGGNNTGYADGFGLSAKFNFPNNIVVDLSGNIFVADMNNNLIRKITPDGTITTLAGDSINLGNHIWNSGYADGTNSNARFNGPTGLALDTTGGNTSATNIVSIFYYTTAPLQIQISGLGSVTSNYNNVQLTVGRNYSITSSPATGFVFTNWTISTNWVGGLTVQGTNLQFMMQSNLTLLASFMETSRPSLNITAPTNTQRMTNALAFGLGTASDNWAVSNVWYQINGGNWLTSSTTNHYTNWNTPTLTLLSGNNSIKAYAVNLGGNVSLTNSITIVSSNTFALNLNLTNAFVLRTNGVGFNLQLSPNLNGHIEWSTNLINWFTLTNFVGTNSAFGFRDPGATNSVRRFYRAVIP